ncbi:MAG: hypothetical protein LBJ36_02555 [Synergistaceae bacterium]|nr:hypothetical protein [Synergistaceae bacterium]
MNKNSVEAASSIPITVPAMERPGFSARRIFHRLERQYLSWEAQSMAYCLLDSQFVPLKVTENAIQQAVALGSISGAAVDLQTFEALFHAVALNPSFSIPFAFASYPTPFGSWIC